MRPPGIQNDGNSATKTPSKKPLVLASLHVELDPNGPSHTRQHVLIGSADFHKSAGIPKKLRRASDLTVRGEPHPQCLRPGQRDVGPMMGRRRASNFAENGGLTAQSNKEKSNCAELHNIAHRQSH